MYIVHSQICRGRIHYDDKDITNLAPHKIVDMGISQVPEGRLIFSNLTVKENLEMGAYRRKDKQEIKKIWTSYSRYSPASKVKAAWRTLSGGEQQMLAMSRALMSRPKLLLMDEPSLGIAPILVKTIFEKILEINRTLGTTILLVEQNARLALSIANYGYVLETGNIILEGAAKELASNEQVRKAYLGREIIQ